MEMIWTFIIGFIAGVIAKFVIPGPNEPSGLILTTILGIIGAFVATYLGQALGWYRPARAPVCSARWSARSSCSSSGAGGQAPRDALTYFWPVGSCYPGNGRRP